MSNLYKAYCVKSNDQRSLDYNKVIQDKIAHIIEESKNKHVDPDGFVTGLDAQIVETLVEDGQFEGDFAQGLENVAIQQPIDTEAAMAELEQQKAGMLAMAREEANRIIEEAKMQAEDIRANAMAQGREEGLSEAHATMEAERIRIQNDFDQRSAQLEAEYESMKAELEPQLVETITNLFEKIVHVVSEEDSQIVIDLINNVLKTAEGCDTFLIRVSPDDYQFVSNHQGLIYCGVSKDLHIDVLEDNSLTKSQCRVETDFGVYDCSLDIQMTNLIKEIKLLSSLS